MIYFGSLVTHTNCDITCYFAKIRNAIKWSFFKNIALVEL